MLFMYVMGESDFRSNKQMQSELLSRAMLWYISSGVDTESGEQRERRKAGHV